MQARLVPWAAGILNMGQLHAPRSEAEVVSSAPSTHFPLVESSGSGIHLANLSLKSGFLHLK